MHMLKSIVTTPKIDSFTYSLLRDLNFRAVILRFGIFSLQMQNYITLKIPQLGTDRNDVIEFVLNSTGTKKKRIDPIQFDNRRTFEYPLGTHPTWQEITDTLLSHPLTLISTRCGNNFWNGSFTPLQMIIVDLMIKFSRQYWFTLHPDFLVDTYPKPTSWKDVMDIWSVEGIRKLVHNPVFVPHKFHWSGLPRGPGHWSFADRANLFFPPLDADLPANSIWRKFVEKGYIKDYHAYLSDDQHSEEEKTQLQEGLKQAFDFLDCLPNREQNLKAQPWRFDAEANGLTFMVNAKTYRILGVGTVASHQNRNRQKLTTTGLEVDAQLIADTQGMSLEAARRQVVRERRSTWTAKSKKGSRKRKGKRQPPLNRAQQKTLAEIIQQVELEEGESRVSPPPSPSPSPVDITPREEEETEQSGEYDIDDYDYDSRENDADWEESEHHSSGYET